MTRPMWAAARAQLHMSLHDTGDLFPLVLVPFYSVIFLAIVRSAGRDDLLGYAVIAPVLLNLWYMALVLAGDLVARDRFFQIIECLVATPTPYAQAGVGRILTATLISLVALPEAWLVARIGFGYTLDVHHWALFIVTLTLTLLATAGNGVILSALFVVGRTPRMLQNSLSYPIYVLGGILTPVSLLPGWLQVPARLLYLSWAADLLRDCLKPATPRDTALRLMAIGALAVASMTIGLLLMGRVIDRLRLRGGLGLT